MIARAVTDLPDPDSPTTHRISSRWSASAHVRDRMAADPPTAAVRPSDPRSGGSGAPASAMRSNDPQARVQRVVESVADEVDRQHREEDRDAGNGAQPPRTRRKLRPAPIMNPQLIMFGSPRPRNDNADSIRIAVATISEPVTMIDDRAFGRMWRRSRAVAHAHRRCTPERTRGRASP